MPTYTYIARDQRGVAQSGQLDAVDEDEVVAILQHRGLLVTSVSQRDLEGGERSTFQVRARPRRMHGRVTTADQVLLCQQMATLIDAGVPLIKSLEVVTAQVESRSLLMALEEIRRDVQAGSTLRQALARHPKIFSNLWLNLVETGEAGGHLGQSLQQLARHFESIQRITTQAQVALTYPTFLIAVAGIVVTLFVYLIIPKFATMFLSMNTELPLITRIVIGVSVLARQYWWAALAALVGTIVSVRWYLQTDSGQWMRDRLLLHLPWFKGLVTYLQLAEFSRGLSTLLKSGVPLLNCLQILESSATNRFYGRAIGQVKEAVKEGAPLAQPMDETGLFPPMTVQMVHVGEEVGELAAMVERIAVYNEDRVEAFIAKMTRLFEPIGIVVVGGLLLVIVVAIYLPIFQMAGSAGG